LNLEFANPFWLPAVVAFAVALIAQRLFLNGSLRKITLDYPNHRSLHSTPTPRTGGLAIAIAVACSWPLVPGAAWSTPAGTGAPWSMALGACALALAAVSLLDDMRGLSAALRLTAHFAVCAAFLYMLEVGWTWVLLLLLPMVWTVNLYNFMDGLDGLAAGMTIFGFGAYALLAILHDGTAVAAISICVAAAALGFLPFNFAPARAFLGDVGSIPLGFLAAAIGVVGWHDGLWQLWIPLVIFSPFAIDATVTLARRFLRGVRLTEAHREHYYQLLAQAGFGHRTTALLEYALMLFAAAAAIVMALGENPIPVLALVALGVTEIACLLAVGRLWKRFQINNGQGPLR
jgi:UDP-N-acetylmuramyl pentapeptide phosphotransferase/UDP-N-acetylglucosamine-1-phosphate transferase